MEHSLCSFKFFFTRSGQVTELWRHKRRSLRPIFQRNGASAAELDAIDWLGDIMSHSGQKMTTSDLWHCILTFQMSSDVNDLGWPVDTSYSVWIGGFGGLLRPWDRILAHFSHRHVYSVSWHYLTSIRDFMVIDTDCPQAILPLRMTLFHSGM